MNARILEAITWILASTLAAGELPNSSQMTSQRVIMDMKSREDAMLTNATNLLE